MIKGKKVLSNIFNSIKKEELELLTQELIQEKGRAVQNGQIDSSTYAYAKVSLSKSCINTVYKRILDKLKTDKLNHFIKKDSKAFLEFISELTYEVFDIITTEGARTNSVEENDFLDKAYKDSLLELKNEIIEQWNNEANIQRHLKKHERSKELIKVLIIPLAIGLILTITGVIVNQYIIKTKPVEKIIEKELSPTAVIEKIQTSPEAKKEASHIYKIFKDIDGEKFLKFLKELYLKIS